MSRNSASGRGSSGDAKEGKEEAAMQLMGIVVESSGTDVCIHSPWIHQEKGIDVVRWDKGDSYDNLLMAGDWATMVWRKGRVTKVTRFNGEPPMKVRQCRRTKDVLVLAALYLKEPDAGKQEKQLWHEEFHSIGVLNHSNTRDMRVGGGTKDMWIAWVRDKAERDRHLQRTGYDVVWKVAWDQGEELYANGQTEQRNWAEDSGVSSQITSPHSQSGTSAENENESKTERVRKRGSFPGKNLNRVGIITGHKTGSPFYYVWTPGAPPMMEGKIIVHKVKGEEQIQVCDWIHFRISQSDEESIFMNRDETNRFEVVDWELVPRYFPTQLSPNKQTIEIAISKMVMTSANTKLLSEEVFYEDDDFGWIGDRNNMFRNDYPLAEGTVIEFEGVIRRVRPRWRDDSAWMILSRKVTYKGMRDNKKKEQRRPEREERRGSNGRVERREDCRQNEREEYQSNGREEHRSNGRQEKRDRRDHYLMHPPRYEGQMAGNTIESTAFVEGKGADGAAFLWLVDAAASGVVNGGAKHLQLGDVVYGKFRKQDNGKWRALGEVRPDELPGDMTLQVRRDKVYVKTQIIYDAERHEYRNPWFDVVSDQECKIRHDSMDKEVYEVELSKMRSGFNISKLLTY